MPSKHEKVLLSASQSWPEGTFTAEDLVIACWQAFPDDFGLQGYEQSYPDSSVVYRHIMGQNSLVKKHKWFLQVGAKTYKVSISGAARALQMQDNDGPQTSSENVQKIRIDRARESTLSRLLQSIAWQKHWRGDEIVFR